MTIDLLEEVAPSSGDLGAVAKVGLQMQELEKEVEQLDTQLRLKKQTLRTLAESTLPDLMQELNIRNFTLNNGAKVSVSEVISAALPTATAIERARGEEQLQLAERKYDGLEWLRDNGGSSAPNQTPNGGTNGLGGGSGGSGFGADNPNNGGNGVVIIRRLTSSSDTDSGAVTTDGSDTIHTFNASGS